MIYRARTNHPYRVAAGIGFLVAFLILGVMHYVPVLGNVPGHFLCDGTFEFVRYRKVGYGLCDGERVGYGTVMLVTQLVYSVPCIPLALVITWLARRRMR